MEIYLILIIPVVLAIISALVEKPVIAGTITTIGYGVELLISFCFANKILAVKHFSEAIFYADALSAFFILTVSLITFASALYSISFIEKDVQNKKFPESQSKIYYLLFNLFTFSMYLVTLVNNLGFVWIAIEMTTLASAFLVGFYNSKHSVEAAWKYIIICSVGITLALLGTILFYYTVSHDGGIKSLNWTDFISVASKLDGHIIKIAFLFILVGYGTKAGLAPMHTWLPDAHSQAVTPISALLSGVLLKTSVYAIMRFAIVTNKAIGSGYTSHLFVFFGLISITVAAVFVLVQKDLKRLLAYSSVEHIGIIVLGLGFGGPIGCYGALLHTFNHAATKAVMFFGAGEIIEKYNTHNMRKIKGAVKAIPFAGVFTIITAFALSGMPPFSVFFSEMAVLYAGFVKGSYMASVVYIFVLAVVFYGLVEHIAGISFGKKPEDMIASKDPSITKAAFIFLFVFVCVSGFLFPGFFNSLLKAASGILLGNI
ncbi:MAG: hydrogenase 4 subunit F [Elusimicrobia bacterium]|nr:hydrogenase 4 subunit F [Elusimicrobiota bacterium]